MELICFSCQKPNKVEAKISFREECFHCKADLHCCKNCFFHDTKVYNECKEPAADVVKEKEKANYCDFFKPSEKGAMISEKDRLRAQAEALFKKK